MNINEMPAGPELDALVAKKVMGRRDFCADDHSAYVGPGSVCGICDRAKLVPYSQDMAMAWLVFEELRSLAYGPEIWGMVRMYRVRLYVPAKFAFLEIESEDAPLAICRAALKAVGA